MVIRTKTENSNVRVKGRTAEALARMQSLGIKFGLLGLGVKAQGLGQKWEARVNIMPHPKP